MIVKRYHSIPGVAFDAEAEILLPQLFTQPGYSLSAGHVIGEEQLVLFVGLREFLHMILWAGMAEFFANDFVGFGYSRYDVFRPTVLRQGYLHRGARRLISLYKNELVSMRNNHRKTVTGQPGESTGTCP